MTPVQLLCTLANEFGVGVQDLRGLDRTQPLSAMRAIAMATIRQHCGLSYPKLAKLFGRLDHTTAMSAVRRSEAYRVEYPYLASAAFKAAGVNPWSHEIMNESLEMCAS